MVFELVIYYTLIGIGVIVSIPLISLLAIWLSCKVIKSLKK
jgi:hypothetical protein